MPSTDVKDNRGASRRSSSVDTLSSKAAHLKKYVITLLKLAIPAAIILWLLSTLDRDRLWQLQSRPKDWGRLAAAFVLVLSMTFLGFFRWWVLVRALHLRFRLRDAFRLGSLGFLLNFVSVGSVGGDLFKAFFIAREQPGRRTEAVATVVLDRVIGLYGLLLVTSAAILLSDIHQLSPAISAICRTTLVATAIGSGAILIVLMPGFTRGSLVEFLNGLPKVGATLERLITSLRMYRSKPLVMVAAVAMSMGVHSLIVLSCYLIATGLFANTPTLREHFIIVPLANAAAGLPFTPAGLGSFEFAMALLYAHVPRGGRGDVAGILVALAYRLITIAVAAVGVVYYWTSRAEMREVIREAESS